MTVIFDNGEFWIETFHLDRSSVTMTSTLTNSFPLEKPGLIVGASAAIDCDSAELEEISISLVNSTVFAALVYGSSVTAVTLIRRNDGAVAQTFGANIILFLKK